MGAEPYAAATGPGASSAAIAMAEPEPQAERVPEARAEEDSFIAPRPAEPEAEAAPEASGYHAEPDPFAEAALANAARREPERREMAPPPAPQPSRVAAEQRAEPQAATPPVKRGGQSLFAKVTGAARALASSQAGESGAARQQPVARPMPGRSASPAQPERQAAAPAASRPAPGNATAGPAGNAAQPRLSGLDPAERIGHSQAEEDLLDIPAFLRRQAN